MRLPFVIFVLFGAACSKLTSPPAPEPIASDTPVTMASAPTVPSTFPQHDQQQQARPSPTQIQLPPQQGGELKIEDEVMGKGPEVKNGDIVTVHYVGTLLDGTKFDASRDHPARGNQPAGAPMTTPIPGNLIKGWNQGLLGMKAGGKRKLTVPPSLAYGPMPRPGIPANSTLVFEIELLEVKANPRPQPVPKGP